MRIRSNRVWIVNAFMACDLIIEDGIIQSVESIDPAVSADYDFGDARIVPGFIDIHTHGVTVIRVTHSMEAAAQHEQVVVLSNAGLLMQGVPEEVFSPAHEQVLHDAGLGLPEPLRWAMHLSLDETPLTLEALADAIMAARGCSDGI